MNMVNVNKGTHSLKNLCEKWGEWCIKCRLLRVRHSPSMGLQVHRF